MKKRYSDGGDLIITVVEEETVVRVRKDGGVVVRQDIGGDSERVYLSVADLRQIMMIITEEEL